MAKLLTNYRQSAQNVITGFDFVDLATGTAYKTFYGGRDSEDNYVAHPFAFHVDVPRLYNRTAGTVAPTTTELNFDILFNRSLLLDGRLWLVLPFLCVNNSGSGNTLTIQSDVKIYHFDGTTETELDSLTESSGASIASTENYIRHVTLGLDITSKKFLKGEILRIEIIYSYDLTPNFIASLCHDPLNRTIGTATGDTQLLIYVPFKLT